MDSLFNKLVNILIWFGEYKRFKLDPSDKNIKLIINVN
jgi:hypothetical protein